MGDTAAREDFNVHGEPKNISFYSGSVTPLWSLKMTIFDQVRNPLPPTLSPHGPFPEKQPLSEGLTTEERQKERGNA